MNKKIIFISKYDNTLNGANKIKDKMDNCDILVLEDYNKDLNINNSNIYFLCNTPLISKIVKGLNSNNYIFNKEYYLSNYKKKDAQILLEQNNINVPKIIDYNKIENNIYPIFCKENNHVGIIFLVYNKLTLDKFFKNFNINKFYLEEKLDNTYEYKVYYVNKKVFFKDKVEIYDLKINNICENISKILKLEIFSVDLIKIQNEYYVIDVNPSSAFYLSNKARLEFIKINKK